MDDNLFYVSDDTECNFVAVRLTTPEWIIDFHLSYLDWGTEEFELYGDEPLTEYVGEGDYVPIFPYDDYDLSELINKAKWI